MSQPVHILVINVGSSSLKASVVRFPDGQQIFKHEVPTTGESGEAVQHIGELLRAGRIAPLQGVGHRVVHGGDAFDVPTRIDDETVAAIESLNVLAPLHNPPALAAMDAARRCWPEVPHYAVFDTVFHRTIPAHAATYAVPESWRKAGVRRFGFHGTSHKYVMEHVARSLDASPRSLRLISCHLGNGASICAIDRGRSVDTSMGLTPLEGLVMGSRCGDVDPGLVGHVQRVLGLSVEEIEDALYRSSGLVALAGRGNDMRAVEAAAGEGDAAARLALDVYAYRVKKYIGAYAAAMGGVDVLAFTGGIGENSAAMRASICGGLEFLGLRLDAAANAALRLDDFEAPRIDAAGSRVRVVVTRTREQWMIAQEVYRRLADDGTISA